MSNLDAEAAYLKKEGVYDHLGKIVDRIIAEKPKDACGLVEVLSRLVQASAGGPVAEQPDAVAEQAEAIAAYFQKARQLDTVPVGDDGAVAPVCDVPNYVAEAEMLSWAGVGFGELESYRIMCSLRGLANKEGSNISRLRFWGMILGTGADYYVAEASRDQGEAPEGEEEMEVPGTPGVNLYAYYVTTDLCGEWRQLPDIRPSEIVAARGIRRLLTGDGATPVITHPYFDGTEETLLRAQIARISADTTLCIRGFLKRPEDDPEADPQEDEAFVFPPPPELLKMDTWTHMAHHILQNGRTAYLELPDDLDEQEKAKIEEERNADKPRDLIRGLVGDKLEWSIKQVPCETLLPWYLSPLPRTTEEAQPKPFDSTLVTCVRSLTWPGAVTVARGKQCVNLYVGYGLLAKQPEFFPPEPPDVQEEPDDPGEEKQPPGTEEDEDVAGSGD